MASFMHLADAKQMRRIEKNGIKAGKRGVYCLPVTRNFSTTHQWSRELKRTGVKTFICVQFRVSDDEMVTLGRYDGEKISLTAAESAAAVAEHTAPLGLEVIFSRTILPKEITRIYPAPKVVGWRFSPESKGKKPFCHCRFCNRGEIRAQRLIREDE